MSSIVSRCVAVTSDSSPTSGQMGCRRVRSERWRILVVLKARARLRNLLYVYPLTLPAVDKESRATRSIWSWYVVVSLVCALPMILLGGCSAHSRTSAPHSGVANDASLPRGWMRYSYGSLSVGAPATWKIDTLRPSICASPPDQTVSEFTDSSTSSVSCPAGLGGRPIQAVELSCLVGQANQSYSGAATTTVNGQSLGRSGNVVYLQGDGSEGIVSLPEPFDPALDDEILGTVAPTGHRC